MPSSAWKKKKNGITHTTISINLSDDYPTRPPSFLRFASGRSSTCTPFPYTTLFRSVSSCAGCCRPGTEAAGCTGRTRTDGCVVLGPCDHDQHRLADRWNGGQIGRAHV